MSNYIARLKERTPHERRQFALRTALIVTAVVFVGWAATLSVRLATEGTRIANTVQNSANTAAALEAVTGTSVQNNNSNSGKGWFGF